MTPWIEQFKAAIHKAQNTRDRTLLALTFALPDLTLDELARLRVEDVPARVAGHPLATIVLKLLEGRPPGLVFPSRKGRPRPARHGLPAREERPATRQTLWRALRRSLGGVQTIRKIAPR